MRGIMYDGGLVPSHSIIVAKTKMSTWSAALIIIIALLLIFIKV